jgi:hypothetical protein
MSSGDSGVHARYAGRLHKYSKQSAARIKTPYSKGHSKRATVVNTSSYCRPKIGLMKSGYGKPIKYVGKSGFLPWWVIVLILLVIIGTIIGISVSR